MRLSVKYFYVVLLLAVFISCGTSIIKKEFCNDKGQQVIQEWFNDKQIKSDITYLDKSGNNYISILYNKEGRMIDSATYKNGVLNGRHKYYDENSGLIHIENYKNGVPDGVISAVFENGVTNFEGYMLNGSKVGQWIFHYKNGSPITYEFYDSSGNVKYFRKYDDTGGTENISGSGIINIVLNLDKSDTATLIKAGITLAAPPGCTTELTIINDGITAVDSYQVSKPSLEFVFPVAKTGKSKLNFKLTIKDEKSGRTEEYSLDKTINVK